MFGIWRLQALAVPLDLRMRRTTAIPHRTKRAGAVAAGAEEPGDLADALGVPVVRVTGVASAWRMPSMDRYSLPRRTRQRKVSVYERHHVQPRGVLLTHGQLESTALASWPSWEHGGHPERGLAIIPLSHLYGQVVPLFLGLVSGSTLIFLEALTPSTIASTMRRSTHDAGAGAPAGGHPA